MNSEQEFAQSIYTIIKTFVDGPKTVSSLEAYYLSNQKAIKTMKDIDAALYQKLIKGGVSGPGTGTSDDIPAYLSNGEFVITAKAVKNAGGSKPMYDMMEHLEKGGKLSPASKVRRRSSNHSPD